MIEFRQVDSAAAVRGISERLLEILHRHRRVVWIITGGSSIPQLCQVMAAVPEELSGRLAILLSDERYGPPGHADSNMQQYLAAGFTPKQATLVPVLRDALDMKETAAIYNQAVATALSAADYRFATLGMGPDGHVAGILPESEAVNAGTLVTAYSAEKFERITLTFEALRQMDECMLLVFGEPKLQALKNLRDKQLPLTAQPAQIVKKISHCTVWNDQIGGKK